MIFYFSLIPIYSLSSHSQTCTLGSIQTALCQQHSWTTTVAEQKWNGIQDLTQVCTHRCVDTHLLSPTATISLRTLLGGILVLLWQHAESSDRRTTSRMILTHSTHTPTCTRSHLQLLDTSHLVRRQVLWWLPCGLRKPAHTLLWRRPTNAQSGLMNQYQGSCRSGEISQPAVHIHKRDDAHTYHRLTQTYNFNINVLNMDTIFLHSIYGHTYNTLHITNMYIQASCNKSY